MIDFHTHIFPDAIAEKSLPHLATVCRENPCTNGKRDGLLVSTIKAQLDMSIILPVITAPKQFESIHRFALEFQKKPLLSFGGIHPEFDDYKEKLRWIKEQGFLGIKIHPDYQGTYFNDIRYKRILAYASELDLIVVSHAGLDPLSPNDIHCTPKMAAEVIDEVKPTKLVLAHMGGNAMYAETEKYLVGQEVYFDTSYVLDKMPREQFARMVNNHGAERILFASDSPWACQKKFINELRQMPIGIKEQEMILSFNARKLLGMS